jgi:hypothetical protein
MALGVKKKPRLSGAARRKLAKAEKREAAKPKTGDLLQSLDYSEAPDTHDEWRREGRTVYWDVRKGRIDLDSARTLTWAADVNARMAKMAEELRELEKLRQQLAALQGTATARLLSRTDLDGAINGEVVSPEET